MLLTGVALCFLLATASAKGGSEAQARDRAQEAYRKEACPNYKDYSQRRHGPYTEGEYKIPYQRPAEQCRLFRSDAVEKEIDYYKSRLSSPYFARLFENCYPNTLDTTIRWYRSSAKPEERASFIVTGDINAQWLRDSTYQLAQYQHLAKNDQHLRELINGAINTQAEFVLLSPYCNAFQPPPDAHIPPSSNDQSDIVHPVYDPDRVFECKYEIDSLGAFLALANRFYENTGDKSFLTSKWLQAVETVLTVLEEQSVGTFLPNDQPADMVYTFQRDTRLASETLSLRGIGNPIASNTSLVRSAFRPSDDATILQFFIPGNAFMSVELAKTADMLESINAGKYGKLIDQLRAKSKSIKAGIYEHGVVEHKKYGKVFAFEVDGYGSHIIMDDANMPSLLGLPLLGFISQSDPLYQNTRRMVLDKSSNPYFLSGRSFKGVGGPHIGIRQAWPLSLLVAAMTTDDDKEIMTNLNMVLGASANLGLIHESVNVERVSDYTRSWFAWANSVYAQTIMDLAKRKPHLIFSSSGGSSQSSRSQGQKPGSPLGAPPKH
ncbi:DUF1237 domain-containing protein [Ascodesmis nigricans]|uniref:DUF1237 domain-containing protein n=1 Tax=Ascodesmis nigricans TaxID=341454 RepID=A0A4S2N4M6_9PEZI|nr:DUF1237 domain-containing protein [Ascodesmis nigricans]